jgi:hypothetical protein
MKGTSLFLFVFLSHSICAQITGEDEVYLNGDYIAAKFEGDDSLKKYSAFIKKEFDYSKVTKEGTMIFSFTVEKDGTVKNLKVTQLLDIESAKEIIRVIKKCPNWEPANRSGQPISITIKYPMTFKSNK